MNIRLENRIWINIKIKGLIIFLERLAVCGTGKMASSKEFRDSLVYNEFKDDFGEIFRFDLPISLLLNCISGSD